MGEWVGSETGGGVEGSDLPYLSRAILTAASPLVSTLIGEGDIFLEARHCLAVIGEAGGVRKCDGDISNFFLKPAVTSSLKGEEGGFIGDCTTGLSDLGPLERDEVFTGDCNAGLTVLPFAVVFDLVL